MGDASLITETSRPDIRRGGVYWINDKSLALPEGKNRTVKYTRPVIVVSRSSHCQNPVPATVLVVPLTTNYSSSREWDVLISAASSCLPKDSRANIGALQPVRKEDLKELIGDIEPFILHQIEIEIATYLGLDE